MPELPEVETIRRFLEPALTGRRVTAVRIVRPDVITPFGPDAATPRRKRTTAPAAARTLSRALLLNATIDHLERKGKQLAILTADSRAIVVHLGMTGQLLLRAARADSTLRAASTPAARPHAVQPGFPADHIHIRWRLDDGAELLFRDTRRFGGILAGLTAADLHAAVWSRLGPDALTITAAQLRRALGGSTRAVKAALLDQSAIAGVGNIYADEACFRAAIHPARIAGALSPDETRRLAQAIRTVLRNAVAARGSTLRDYVTPSGTPGEARMLHLVYGRAGLPCPRCGTPLQATKVAQRTTVHCPRCQEEHQLCTLPRRRTKQEPFG